MNGRESIGALEVAPGNVERRGRGTAWDAWSRKIRRIVHIPSDAEFSWFLELEFDAEVSSLIEQPCFSIPMDGLKSEGQIGSFYIERISGVREVHVLSSQYTNLVADKSRVVAYLINSGIKIIEIPIFNNEMMVRRQNLVTLLGLTSQSEADVDVCATSLMVRLNKDMYTVRKIIEIAGDSGFSSTIAARALGILAHRGSVDIDLNRPLDSQSSVRRK